MIKDWSRLALVLMLSGLVLPSAFAKDACSFLGLEDSELSNSGVFYLTSQGWKPFTTFSAMQIANKQAVTFAYVVREMFRGERSGALVIKSGVYARDRTDASQGDKVLLVRKETTTDQECPAPKSFRDTVVSGKGYEDYHEYQLTETEELRKELPIFERFHIKYRGDRECIGTDDSRTTLFRSDHNASQFSYNTDVVDGGARVSVRFNLLGRPSYAGPGELWQRRTEIKYYRTVKGFYCAKFNLLVSGDDRNFIRINDLEGRAGSPSTKRLQEFRVEN